MTLIAVPIFVRDAGEVGSAIARAARAAEFGADLIEWRVDALCQDEVALVDEAQIVIDLVRQSPLPSIVTFRSVAQGGEFRGTPIEQCLALGTIVRGDARPRYLDVELETSRHSADVVKQVLFRSGAPDHSIIFSSHDFDDRPADLLGRVAQMADDPACDVIKIAWRARSLRDNLEAFDLLHERPKPMIAICMGEFGLPSRVLAPKFGGFITFAAADADHSTAPGQPTLDDLVGLYRIDSINKDTAVYGIVGWPIDHSLSPLVHNTGFAAVRHNGVYLPLPVPPEWEHFKATMGELVDHPRLNFRGASVTLPHKEHLLRFVEERGGRIDADARAAGAANTLLVGASGAVVCRNTDAPAIVECLSTALNVDAKRLREFRIAILGAGGVARAALAGLMKHHASATVFNRTPEKCAALASEMNERSATLESAATFDAGDPQTLATQRFDVYINCTSVGMSGGSAPNVTPFEELCGCIPPIDDSTTLFETVYAPSRTPLIELAELRGARAVLGIDLFIHQAVLQFESWTGGYAPFDAFRTALATAVES